MCIRDRVNIDNLPAVSAQTLDITTGVINYNASVPWSKLSMNFSGEGFRMLYDRRGTFIRYEQPYTMSGFYKNSTAELKSYKIRSFKLSKAFILLTEGSKRTFGGAYCLIDRR